MYSSQGDAKLVSTNTFSYEAVHVTGCLEDQFGCRVHFVLT